MPASASSLKLRDRLVTAARDLTALEGWMALTMSKVAKLTGVSRQTVYNLLGDKQKLAETLVMNELARFLEIVDNAFEPRPDRLRDGVRMGVQGCLEYAADNPLVREIIGASYGQESELLKLVTTDSAMLRQVAVERLYTHASGYESTITDEHLRSLCDMAVRLTLSMILSPEGTPAQMAERVAWFAQQVFEAPTSASPRVVTSP
ncbi:MAG TPA: TetR family transcriptional regulator [Marmoricola sp.]|nr:TetR family transcriptional regulator [Nocardioidaceae bacterium]MCO5324030.1 TetR family transcriptional regulator [Nocardioidaceae bacterium]HRV70055.1 TetR family transcriptional regulator [Marmoricola sp.]